MSRKDRKNDKKKTKSGSHRTQLSSHQRQGNMLLPPMASLPNLRLSSWMNDRLPEMLWAALVITGLERADGLDLFRRVADYARKFEGAKISGDITHSGMQKLDENSRRDIIAIITGYESASEVLRPLLLFNDLPAREDWFAAIFSTGVGDPQPDDWNILSRAVARTLGHQSEESTDCRWMRVLFQVLAGRMHFASEFSETVKGILRYPDYGDLKSVRPSIRAMEGSLQALFEDNGLGPDGVWAKAFWAQCLVDTHCLELPESRDSAVPRVGTTVARVNEVYDRVIAHAYDTCETSAVDPKHDTVFGTVLYCLSVLREVLGIAVSEAIIGRTALRLVVENYITLAYLVVKDDPELWKSYRVYGAGQAKLALLHLERFEERPEYVTTETLEQLADEDVWSEYLSINLGHWEKSNLRSMSEVASVKDVYDQYYPWTSTYLHGHWGAIRDSVFQPCFNPLHRLHRIPRQQRRALEDVMPDLCSLCDKILDLLDQCYPHFEARTSLAAGT